MRTRPAFLILDAVRSVLYIFVAFFFLLLWSFAVLSVFFMFSFLLSQHFSLFSSSSSVQEKHLPKPISLLRPSHRHSNIEHSSADNKKALSYDQKQLAGRWARWALILRPLLLFCNFLYSSALLLLSRVRSVKRNLD